jgi:hypothetical protein
MIYLFGKGKSVSIIYAPETLTEESKKGGIAVEALPPQEDKEGYNAILCLDKNNKPYWEYEKIIEEVVEEETPKE